MRPRGLKPEFSPDALRGAEAPLFHVTVRFHVTARHVTARFHVAALFHVTAASHVPGIPEPLLIRSELYGDWLAVGFGGLEELARREIEHAGENIRGEDLNLGVEVAHDCVVVAARVLDGVFGLA